MTLTCRSINQKMGSIMLLKVMFTCVREASIMRDRLGCICGECTQVLNIHYKMKLCSGTGHYIGFW